VIGDTETWLFGSHARGDSDELSDVDVLIAGSGDPSLELDVAPDKISTITFSWKELEHMASYGSLFLHHVRREGRALGQSPRLDALLSMLPEYQRAAVEVTCFDRVLVDVRRAMERDHSPTFELGVLGTTLRHACILGCYLRGDPAYGRCLPFTKYAAAIGMSHLGEEMTRLYAFRMHLDARTVLPFVPTTHDVQKWLSHAEVVLANVRADL
jgi:hypothetical protein